MGSKKKSQAVEKTVSEPFLSEQNTAVAPPYISKPVQILIKPKKYTSPALMLPVIEDYFNGCDLDGRKYTIEGLALHLGFTSTEALRVYGVNEGYEAFHDLIKSAKLKVQMQRVQDLQAGKLNPLAGIFLLSNCHDYKRDPDKYSREMIESSGVEVALMYTSPENNEEENTITPEADGEAGSELSEAV